MNEQELECINLPIPCNNEANRLEKSNMYDNEGNEKTLNTSENKEKERYGYVSMYEWGKQFFHSMYECTFTAKALSISRMGKLLAKYKYEYEDKQERIIVYHQ